MATWTFRPPTVDEGPASWEDPLLLRVKLARGISILEGPPGVYRAARFPTQDEIAASQPHMFMGGHEYEVDDSTRAALLASGAVTPDDFTTTSSLYGMGGYGAGLYGG